MKSVSMKGFDNLVSSSSLGERYPFERITQVVFITAKIAFIFTSLSAVHINDFDIFTVKKKNKPKKKNKTKQTKMEQSRTKKNNNNKATLSHSVFRYCSDGVQQDRGILKHSLEL